MRDDEFFLCGLDQEHYVRWYDGYAYHFFARFSAKKYMSKRTYLDNRPVEWYNYNILFIIPIVGNLVY
jgi:hypothetical protein